MCEIEEKAEKSNKDERKKKNTKERMEKNATVRKFELFVEIFSRTKKIENSSN